MNHDALLRALRDVPDTDPDAPMREEAAKLIAQLIADAEWQAEKKNNYSKVLAALGMEEEGDPVEEVLSLIEKLRVCELDRDTAWNAFQRLRKAYAMVRYPTLNEEIKLLYDTADAVAHGKANP